MVGNDDPFPLSKFTTAPGQARGALVAVSNTLPGGSLLDSQNVFWTAEPGFTSSGNVLWMAHKRPSDDVNGLWAVALVDGVEVDECFFSWGPSGFEDAASDYSNHALTFRADNRIEVKYIRFIGGRDGLVIAGDNTPVPAMSTVRIYLGVSGGTTIGVPGEGRTDVDAAAALALIADWAEEGMARPRVFVGATPPNDVVGTNGDVFMLFAANALETQTAFRVYLKTGGTWGDASGGLLAGHISQSQIFHIIQEDVADWAETQHQTDPVVREIPLANLSALLDGTGGGTWNSGWTGRPASRSRRARISRTRRQWHSPRPPPAPCRE